MDEEDIIEESVDIDADNRQLILHSFGLIGQFVSGVSAHLDAKHNLQDPVCIKVALYERLISKTGPINFAPIVKHVEAFKSWITNNYDACVKTDIQLLNDEYTNINYSDNVYIPINDILRSYQKETDFVTLIWKHILNIGFNITHDEELKNKLKELYSPDATTEDAEEGGEYLDDVLDTMVSEIEKGMGSIGEHDQKKIFSEMAKNGTLDKFLDTLTTGFEEGKLDLPTIMRFAMKKIKTMGGGNKQNSDKLNQLMAGGGEGMSMGSLMSMLGAIGGGGGDKGAKKGGGGGKRKNKGRR